LSHAEALLQVNLPRGVIQQIATPHDIGNALVRVIHHHRQLIGKLPVGTP